MRRLGVAGSLAVLAALWAAPAAAQNVSIGADVGLNSQYVWRGLSFTNKFPVIQPDVWVNISGLTLGAWANIEPSGCDGTNDLCESGAAGFAPRSGIAEIDLWAEYARTTGNVSWKLGWIIYTFNKDNGAFTNAFDTHEVYGQASIGNLPVTPTLYASYDIGKVEGLYLAPSLTYGVKASPAVTINFTALAGFSAGQEINTSAGANDNFNFFESGLTHVDLAAATSFAAGPVSIGPSVHFQISNDEFTKINGAELANQDKGVKVWFGVLLSWSRALGSSK